MLKITRRKLSAATGRPVSNTEQTFVNDHFLNEVGIENFDTANPETIRFAFPDVQRSDHMWCLEMSRTLVQSMLDMADNPPQELIDRRKRDELIRQHEEALKEEERQRDYKLARMSAQSGTLARIKGQETR